MPAPYYSQAYERYAYGYNNPITYNDPTGHIPAVEICKYLHVCNPDEFKERYGQALFDLLWDTDVSWGSVLVWWEDGKVQKAYLTLLNFDGAYIGGLVGISGKYAGMIFFLDMIKDVGTVGATTLNDPNYVTKDLPPSLYLDPEFCYDEYCEDNGYKVYFNPGIEKDVHILWWLITIGSFTLGPEAPAIILVINTVVSWADTLQDVAGFLGLSTDTAKLWQYYYESTIGTPGFKYPVIDILSKEYEPYNGTKPYAR